MKNKDPDYAIKVEKAIAEKYGEKTVRNPKGSWTDEKEKIYLEQLSQIYEVGVAEYSYEEQINGVFISKKLFKAFLPSV